MLRSVTPETRHWRRSQRITALLLAVWFGVTFAVTFFARELGSTLVGGRLSFWMAAQGSVLVYLLLVWWYGRLMARLDLEFGLAEND